MYKQAAIAVLNSHREAETALSALQISGLDKKKLAIIGKDYQTVDSTRGYYHAGDCMNYWGKPGTFWGPLWGSTALVAVLYSIGIPRDQIIRFETAIKQGFYVLIVHGLAEEISRASALLSSRGHTTEIYASKEATAKVCFAEN